jgi:hypothetical protein
VDNSFRRFSADREALHKRATSAVTAIMMSGKSASLAIPHRRRIDKSPGQSAILGDEVPNCCEHHSLGATGLSGGSEINALALFGNHWLTR